jgi:hypothetical protein
MEMAMDKATQELIERIENSIRTASDDPLEDQRAVSALISEIRKEALVEARRLLKDAMVRAVLEHVGRELEVATTPLEPAPPADEPHSDADQPKTSDEELQKEINAIRVKIAANEGLLREIKAPPQEAREPEFESQADTPGECGGCAYYVYGVVERNDDAQTAHPEVPQESIDPAHPVYRLGHRRLEVLVSKVSLQEFGEEAVRAHLEDMAWLEAKARVHQGVLEVSSIHQAVLPMRFCTIYESEERIRDMLDERYDDLIGALERLRNKQEWGVKVYYNAEALAQQVGRRSDRVRALGAEMEQKTSGMVYFLRKQQEGVVAEEVERVYAECAQRSHDRLAGCACDAAINPLQSKELTGWEDEMILNGAYLVAEERLVDFGEALEGLRAEYEQLGFAYAVTGPWPPYNFARTEEGDEPAGG